MTETAYQAAAARPAGEPAQRLWRRFARLRRWLRPPRRLSFERDGRAFTLFTLVIGLAAVNTGNNLLYLLLGWALAAIVVSGVLSEHNLRRLALERLPAPELFAGRPARVTVRVANRKRVLPAFSLEITELGVPSASPARIGLVLPRGTAAAEWTFQPLRRGRLRLSGFRLATRFPFGFFTKSRDIELPAELIVFPAIRPLRRGVPPDRGGESGAARSAVAAEGDFAGLHEYRPGEDIRHVHWRASARHGHLLVREYERPRERTVVLRVDNAVADATPARLEALESAISDAASRAVDFLRRGYAVGLEARGVALPPAAGPVQRRRVLTALALLEAVGPDTPFSSVGRRPALGVRA